jgi:preprotein translocase, yajC subunit
MSMPQLLFYGFPFFMLGVFYVLIIRPQRKKDKQIRTMRQNLKVGDNITTIGGINGRIVKLSDTTATIEVGSDRTKLSIERWGIRRINEQ